MIVPGSANALLLRSARGYQINQSLRFRASNSAFLSRTLGTPTSSTAFTLSLWFKRGQFGGIQSLFAAGTSTGAPYGLIQFNTSFPDQIDIFQGTPGTLARLITNRVFRDPSAWYHLVYVWDSNNATATLRQRLWINGVEETSFASRTDPTLGAASILNAARVHEIGRQAATATQYWDGYMAEYYLIDGQVLTPSSFGQFDPSSNSWVPRRYTGTYGTNGFYLPFNDATSTVTISEDRSGNGNNWTSSGISVTAGVTFDQMLDTPTNNHAVVNAIGARVTATSAAVLDNANMRVTTNTSAFSNSYWPLTITPQSGSYHIETIWSGTAVTGNAGVCLWRSDTIQSGVGDISYFTSAVGVCYLSNGTRTLNGANAAYGATWTAGDRITMEWNTSTGDVTFFKNGVSQGVIAGAIPSGVFYTPVIYTFNNADPRTPSFTLNCGQQPFVDTPTTGFVALCTANLPTPTIQRGDDAFQATLRTGTGASASVSSLRFQPDLVWIKSRSNATNHNLFDAVRGVNNGLVSNSTAAEYADANSLTAFNSNGYSLGTDGSSRGVNINTNTYVDWAWREGAAYGFDIVTYTGNGANRTIAHGLNDVPHMMIVKNRTSAGQNWAVYHRNMASPPQGNILILNLTNAVAADASNFSAAPTSSVFTVNNGAATNENGSNFVAYLWTSIPDFSLFGGYAGNGSADGTFVYCGFRPRFILIKNITGATSWMIYDAARNTFNVVDLRLAPDAAASEAASGAIDITANGFKFRANDANTNGGATNYIFAAFAETPFKFANGR